MQLAAEELKSCCAATYAEPAVRWLLGGELHPGGEAATRRALELVMLGRGDRLLDVACGSGASALLAAREFGAKRHRRRLRRAGGAGGDGGGEGRAL